MKQNRLPRKSGRNRDYGTIKVGEQIRTMEVKNVGMEDSVCMDKKKFYLLASCEYGYNFP